MFATCGGRAAAQKGIQFDRVWWMARLFVIALLVGCGGVEAVPVSVPDVPVAEYQPASGLEAFETEGRELELAASAELPTLRDALQDSSESGRLLALLDSEGLLTAFDDASAGPWTVFLPSADALQDVDELLLLLSAEERRATVGAHLVPGLLSTADLGEGGSVVSVVGDELVAPGGGLIGDVQLDGEVIEASNGAVMRVDGLLLPRLDAVDDFLVEGLLSLPPVEFPDGESAELDAAARTTLDLAADIMLGFTRPTRFTVTAVGRSTDPADLSIAELRADAVEEILVARGVPQQRVQVIVADEADPESRNLVRIGVEGLGSQ